MDNFMKIFNYHEFIISYSIEEFSKSQIEKLLEGVNGF